MWCCVYECMSLCMYNVCIYTWLVAPKTSKPKLSEVDVGSVTCATPHLVTRGRIPKKPSGSHPKESTGLCSPGLRRERRSCTQGLRRLPKAMRPAKDPVW